MKELMFKTNLKKAVIFITEIFKSNKLKKLYCVKQIFIDASQNIVDNAGKKIKKNSYCET